MLLNPTLGIQTELAVGGGCRGDFILPRCFIETKQVSGII